MSNQLAVGTGPRAGARLLIGLVVALLPLASLAESAVKRVDLRYAYSPGDAFTVKGTLDRSVEMRRTIDGREEAGFDEHNLDRFVYQQVVRSVLPDGRQSAATRRFLVAERISNVGGTRPLRTIGSLQGRTITARITPDGPVITRIRGVDRQTAGMRDQVLNDEYAGVLMGGPRSVGETWPLPKDAASGFYLESSATGTCTLDALVTHAGMECARIVTTAEVLGRDTRGNQANLHLNLTILWSIELKHVVDFVMTARNTVTFETNQGATSVIERTEVSYRQHQMYTWTAFAGKPVKPNADKRDGSRPLP